MIKTKYYLDATHATSACLFHAKYQSQHKMRGTPGPERSSKKCDQKNSCSSMKRRQLSKGCLFWVTHDWDSYCLKLQGPAGSCTTSTGGTHGTPGSGDLALQGTAVLRTLALHSKLQQNLTWQVRVAFFKVHTWLNRCLLFLSCKPPSWHMH